MAGIGIVDISEFTPCSIQSHDLYRCIADCCTRFYVVLSSCQLLLKHIVVSTVVILILFKKKILNKDERVLHYSSN